MNTLEARQHTSQICGNCARWCERNDGNRCYYDSKRRPRINVDSTGCKKHINWKQKYEPMYDRGAVTRIRAEMQKPEKVPKVCLNCGHVMAFADVHACPYCGKYLEAV